MTIGFIPNTSSGNYSFDLDFSGNGDILQNAIYMSLFCNKREISPEFLNKNIAENGWFGNAIMFNNGEFEIGSFLWTLKQTALTQEVINLVISYVEDCLDWLVSDGVIEGFDIDLVDINNNILPEEQATNYILQLSYIPIRLTIKPFLKNELNYSLTIKTNG